MSSLLPEEYYVFPNGPLVVPTDEPSVHNANGFCDDASCPCKKDPELLHTLRQQYENGEVAEESVNRIYHGGW